MNNPTQPQNDGSMKQVIPQTPSAPLPQSDHEPPSKGPNLVVLYVMLALALIAAISFALAIVRPFYLRR